MCEEEDPRAPECPWVTLWQENALSPEEKFALDYHLKWASLLKAYPQMWGSIAQLFLPAMTPLKATRFFQNLRLIMEEIDEETSRQLESIEKKTDGPRHRHRSPG